MGYGEGGVGDGEGGVVGTSHSGGRYLHTVKMYLVICMQCSISYLLVSN